MAPRIISNLSSLISSIIKYFMTAPSASEKHLVSQSNKDTYTLGRDYKSNSRLNYEFYLWKETLQYTLHPKIAIAIQDSTTESQHPVKSPLIADIACGTGIWLRDVALTFPDAQLEGYDINLSQLPPIQWLPPNVQSLQAWNVFSNPESSIVERYDVVHVRLLLVVVQNNDPRPIIRNLMRLLKPGGYLQWDEINIAGSSMLQLNEHSPAPITQGTLQFLKGKSGWVAELPKLMSECGMEDAKLWSYTEREELSKLFFDNHLAKDEEMAQKLKGKEKQQLLDRVQGLYEESKRGTILCTPKIVCVAKKPLNL